MYKGDPIDYYDELSPEAAEYTRLLLSRSYRRRDSPTGPDDS
ncbi:hypothetical protein [Kitasatospora sp. NPDC088351]